VIRVLNLLTNLFPVWVVLGGALALVHPPWFTWFHGSAIVWGLAVIMLGMGITLDFADFRRALAMPRAVAAGFTAQYLIMPFLGWGIARLLRLETPFAVGLILVACCPGGTASNVVTYIARADLPLSVLMTACSTFGAVVLTPLLTKWLAGTYVPVDAWQLFLDTAQVVILPVVAGMSMHRLFPRLVRAVLPVAPLVSVAAIVLICASIIGQYEAAVRAHGAHLFLAVVALHALGFALGYLYARALGYGHLVRRTVAIEVGMQNSGLGVVLTRSNFPMLPTAPVPCAISAVVHSVIGSMLAAAWRLRPPPPTAPGEQGFVPPGEDVGAHRAPP
jgi:bile acid:Na+ symporter, BASS family